MTENIKSLNIANNIINKTVKPVGFIDKFQTVGANKKGAVRILAETRIPSAGIYGEKETISLNENQLIEVELNPKVRVARATKVSNELLNDAVEGYLDNLVKLNELAIKRTIETALLDWYNPSQTFLIEPLIKLKNEVIETNDGIIKYKDALKLRKDFKNFGNDLKDAIILMSADIIGVQNEVGQEFLSYDNVEAGADAMLFGIPVYFVNMPKTDYFKKNDGTYTSKSRATISIINTKGVVQAFREVSTQVITDAVADTTIIKNEIYYDAKRISDTDVYTFGYDVV